MNESWEFVIPWPIGARGKYAGKPIPALTMNFHLSPIVAASRSKRLRSHAARIALLFRDTQHAPTATEHRTLRLVLVRGWRQRLLDTDGMYAALKPIVDGIKDSGWLVDDAPRWCDYTATQTKDNAVGPAVIVRVSAP